MSELEKSWTTTAGFRATAWFVMNSHRCGYVEVPQGHALHGVDYSESTEALLPLPDDEPVGKRGMISILCAATSESGIPRTPEMTFDVHGGITFAGAANNGYPNDGDGWWFGFDCAHAGDGTANTFSTYGADMPVRSLEYVIEECESLALQIVERTALEGSK